MDIDQSGEPSPPPRPTPSSRMALSALVNSPPPPDPPRRLASPVKQSSSSFNGPTLSHSHPHSSHIYPSTTPLAVSASTSSSSSSSHQYSPQRPHSTISQHLSHHHHPVDSSSSFYQSGARDTNGGDLRYQENSLGASPSHAMTARDYPDSPREKQRDKDREYRSNYESDKDHEYDRISERERDLRERELLRERDIRELELHQELERERDRETHRDRERRERESEHLRLLELERERDREFNLERQHHRGTLDIDLQGDPHYYHPYNSNPSFSREDSYDDQHDPRSHLRAPSTPSSNRVRSISPTKPSSTTHAPIQAYDNETPTLNIGEWEEPASSPPPGMKAEVVLEEETIVTVALRPNDFLADNEDVWKDYLRNFQLRRESEALKISQWAQDNALALDAADATLIKGKRGGPRSSGQPKISKREAKKAELEAAIAAGTVDPSLHKKRPRRKAFKSKADIDDELLGLIEGDDAASSAMAPSSPALGGGGPGGAASSVIDPDDLRDGESVKIEPADPIIQPSGLLRSEVIRKVEIGDLSGLAEEDVKQVQDEIWLRKNPETQLRKDGTVRRKPGPSKGWKAMRRRADRIARGEPEDSDVGDTSIAGDGNGTEADDLVAAALDDPLGSQSDPAKWQKKKASGKGKITKKRKLADGKDETTKFAGDGSDEDPQPQQPSRGKGNRKKVGVDREMDEDEQSALDASITAADEEMLAIATTSPIPEDGDGDGGDDRHQEKKKKKKKIKKNSNAEGQMEEIESKPEYKEKLSHKVKIKVKKPTSASIVDDDGIVDLSNADDESRVEAQILGDGDEDVNGEMDIEERLVLEERPTGVSESEAKRRLAQVEELQRQIWSAIVRDVPKIYRVNQAYDNSVRQGSARKAQAAVRNLVSQRNLKQPFRSSAKISKDAGIKAKRAIREMLVYWRKNEKDELAARKKAEREAMERAKAEEEAREAKRQARKLNFLLTQTELYSHFIGKKIKTHEAENMDEGGEVIGGEGGTERKVEEPPAPKGAEHINEELGLDDQGEPLPDIDYDDDDEENLRRHAARGAQAAVQAARDKARAFDQAKAPNEVLDDDTMDGDELNFQNPSLGENSVTITQPKMLMAQLKEYQLKGLTWLGNLYEQGINGILADEMGLGKTIQSISLLAYLAEVHNIWGPFLVIAPASTLHNWQQELTRFVPRLKALPYWGSPKDRETLRRIWNRKNMTFNEHSPFHILVTSYQMAVVDEKYFQMMRWQYMILDEAQAIKSSSSARWKSLLSFNCRNRLLLTGTPIQNSMQELWALLHFIMPSLFDSHEEFSEWFSKDIENAAGGGANAQLKPEQLKRLHMILKPFMLRRVKKHVQKELGDKIEIDIMVDLSQRQRALYKALRQRVSISDLIAQANENADSLGTKNLMNLVMQFRKVCNHPDLFERADVVSPFVFGTFAHSGNLARQGDLLYCPDSSKNIINYHIPKLLVNDGKLDVPGEKKEVGSRRHVLWNLLNIWSTDWINNQLKEEKEGGFGFLKIKNWSAGQANKKAFAHPLVQLIEDKSENSDSLGNIDPFAHVPSTTYDTLPPLREISTLAFNQLYLSRSTARFTADNAVAPFIQPVASDRPFHDSLLRSRSDLLSTQLLYGLTPSERDDPQSFKTSYLHSNLPSIPPQGLLASTPTSQTPIPILRVPAIKRLIIDSAKLARLDDLLRDLKAGGHRVLLYFQMTKMMDLIEEYLIYRQYKYLRLDGSSPIGERRDMVTSWQTNPDIFIFCLSTRAGGLGINLTAADTVVFYDHDWNPATDAQAMDRAHRVGQTKQVTVYRLIARGTIEERIVKLARGKKDVQDIVVGTKSLTDVARPAEIASLFMDDEELAESVAKRKQAEAHGFTGNSNLNALRPRSAFGDSFGVGAGDDEDDFFSLKKTTSNAVNEDEMGDESVSAGGGGGRSGTSTPRGAGAASGRKSKKKGPGAPAADGVAPSLNGDGGSGGKKKRVKIKLGPDGLPA